MLDPSRPNLQHLHEKLSAIEADAIGRLARRIAKKLVPAGDLAKWDSAASYRRVCSQAAGLVLAGFVDESSLWALVEDSRRERPSHPLEAFQGKIVLVTATLLASEMKWGERMKRLLVPSIN